MHDGTIPTDAVASAGSSSDEGKPKHKKDRSQSRKRGGLFGAFLGKKEEHDEKKESKKEEKAEEKAIKNEIKKEEKLEKEEVKAEKKLEKEQTKGGIAGGSAPLDAVAVGTSSRIPMNRTFAKIVQRPGFLGNPWFPPKEPRQFLLMRRLDR